MAIPTIGMRHENAIQYKKRVNEQGLWFALGRTTPWINENTPPDPSGSATSVEECIGYKKAELVTFVRKDPVAGEILYLGERYKAITDVEAQNEKSILILVKATVEYTELPPTTTRQLGIFRGLTPKFDVPEGTLALEPNQVESTGILDVIDNTIPNTRAEYQRDEYSYMLQF